VSPRFKTKTLSGMSREKMIGQVGTVIELNLRHKGRGRLRFPAPILGDDEWQFICEDIVKVGCRVIVKEFSGNSLIVTKFK
jgi:membrane protein implicated in regulation of membrane protease activity